MKNVRPWFRPVALAALLLLFTAPAFAADKSITILWAKWAPADALQKLGEEYTAKTGVTITVDQKPWDATGFPAAKQKEFNTNGTTYDIIIADSQWIGQGVKGNHFADLTDLITQNPDLFKDVAPAALTFYAEYPKASKKYYAIPCESDAMAIAYRKDLFEDPKQKAAYQTFAHQHAPAYAPDPYLFTLNIPKTWQHLLLIAQYFKQASGIDGMAGIVMPTSAGYDQATMSYECLLWAYGGDWGDQTKGTCTINSPESIQALTLMKQLIDASSPQGPNMDYGDVLQAFGSGKSAMALTYFAFFPAFSNAASSKVADQTGYFNVPAGPSGRFTALGGQGMTLNNHIDDARKAQAKDFMKWFSQPDTQKRWAELGGFSANTQVLASDTFKNAAPYNPLFMEAFGMMKDFWNTPEYDQLLTASQNQISQVLQGQKDPAAAIKRIQSIQEKVLKRAAE